MKKRYPACQILLTETPERFDRYAAPYENLFSLPHKGGSGRRGPGERPSRGVGQSPTLFRRCTRTRRVA
jgi:hypothetical protein